MRTGLAHGDATSANIIPTMKEQLSGGTRVASCGVGNRRIPASHKPMRTVSVPTPMFTGARYWTKSAKNSDETRPSATLTMITPSTNEEARRSAAVREASFEAPIYERFNGSMPRMQGEMLAIRPPNRAIGYTRQPCTATGACSCPANSFCQLLTTCSNVSPSGPQAIVPTIAAIRTRAAAIPSRGVASTLNLFAFYLPIPVLPSGRCLSHPRNPSSCHRCKTWNKPCYPAG